MPTDHELLGVSRDASLEEIRKAWRRKVSQLHPDRNPDDPEGATAATAAVNAAWDRIKAFGGGSSDPTDDIYELSDAQLKALRTMMVQWLVERDIYSDIPEPHIAHRVGIAPGRITYYFDTDPKPGRNILFWPKVTGSDESCTINGSKVVWDEFQIDDDAEPSPMRERRLGNTTIDGHVIELRARFYETGSYRASTEEVLLRFRLAQALLKPSMQRALRRKPKKSLFERAMSAVGL